jgi:hypothetical protein
LNCNEHHEQGEWCWKPLEPPFNGKKCIPLKAAQVSEWVNAIKEKVATKFSPPESETFWSLKSEATGSKGVRRGRRTSEPPSYPRSPVVIQLDDRHYRHTPWQTRAVSEFNVSPVRGFTPDQYNTDGVLAYLEYLRVVFMDDSFRDMYPILNQHRMGIDIFKSSMVTVGGMRELKDELKQDCGIAIGMARRLVENFQSWHKTLGA